MNLNERSFCKMASTFVSCGTYPHCIRVSSWSIISNVRLMENHNCSICSCVYMRHMHQTLCMRITTDRSLHSPHHADLDIRQPHKSDQMDQTLLSYTNVFCLNNNAKLVLLTGAKRHCSLGSGFVGAFAAGTTEATDR